MTKGNLFKVGFCVAYDWEMLKHSLPPIYRYAHSICLSIDKNRKSWSGKPYKFDWNNFQSWVMSIDTENKISVYEDNFYLPDLSAIENDNRQRMLMSRFMKPGGWHIQIDSDEFFLDFENFTNYLLRIYQNPTGKEKPINVCCFSISIFKKTANGYLVVDNGNSTWESFPIATNKPEYLNARRNSHFNHLSPFGIVHETWARSETQLEQKLDSWGHENDFTSKGSYLNLWKAVDEYNFSMIYDFHPMQKGVWLKLKYFESADIHELGRKIQESKLFRPNRLSLALSNSRNYHRLIKWWKRLRE